MGSSDGNLLISVFSDKKKVQLFDETLTETMLGVIL